MPPKLTPVLLYQIFRRVFTQSLFTLFCPAPFNCLRIRWRIRWIHTSHATSALQRCYLLAVVMNGLWENFLWIYIKTAIFIQLCVHLIPIQLCEISHIWHTAYQTKLENLPILMLCGILLYDQWCLSNLVLKLHQIWKFENQFYNWTTEPLSAIGHLDSLNLTGLSRLKSQSHKSFVSLNDHFVRSQTWLRISSTVMFFFWLERPLLHLNWCSIATERLEAEFPKVPYCALNCFRLNSMVDTFNATADLIPEVTPWRRIPFHSTAYSHNSKAVKT